MMLSNAVKRAVEQQMEKQWTPMRLGPARRIGNAVIHAEMFEKLFKYRINTGMDDFKMRSAGVLMGADGIGKTCTALTYPCGAVRAMYKGNGWRHVCVYIGPLTPCEKEFILKDTYFHPDIVIFARLVGFLSQLHRFPEVFERHDSDDHVVLDGLCADSVLDFETRDMVQMLETLKKTVVRLIAGLYPEASVVTVLLNIDEADCFNKFGEQSKDGPEGARNLLLSARNLQLDILKETKGRCVLSALATAPSIANIYELGNMGLNYNIECAPITLEDFTRLGVAHSKTVPNPHVGDAGDIGLLAAALYPRVHHLKQYIESGSCDALEDIHDDCIAPFVLYTSLPKSIVPPIAFTDTKTILHQLKGCHATEFVHRVILFMLQLLYGPRNDFLPHQMYWKIKHDELGRVTYFDGKVKAAPKLQGDRPLCEQLKELLEMGENEAVWVYCGAEAPIPCILIWKVSEVFHFWYCDVRPVYPSKTVLAEVGDKAKALNKKITSELGVTIQHYTVSVITHCDFTREEWNEVRVLCPNVLSFEPWTSIMYEMCKKMTEAPQVAQN